jgi:hypothetical protein
MSDRSNLNVSRRLMRMLKVSGLPRVGGAHTLRMRYVQVKHALLILNGKYTRESIAKAKQELLEGWSSAEEQHSEVGVDTSVDLCCDPHVHKTNESSAGRGQSTRLKSGW